MKRRLVSILLALCMVLSLLPGTAWAEAEENEAPTESNTLEESEAPAENDAPEENDDGATSGTCGDNVTWSYSDGTLTISGTGRMNDFSNDTQPWYDYHDQIHTVRIADGVTSIGNAAFRDCYEVTSVSVPNSITSIGQDAFLGCNYLTSASIPDSVISIGKNAFGCCFKLTSVSIPNSVTKIGEYAFNDCTSLTNVSIPDSVTTIGHGAFSDCTSLTSASIPNSVTSIEGRVFQRCTSLTSVTIPNSVTSIGMYAFENCKSLTSVNIPNSVTSIEDSAFAYSGLTSVSIPDSITRIGWRVFQQCTSLTSVTIPNSIISIWKSAFQGCTNLTDVYYGGTGTQWEAILIDDDNDPLTSAVIHYNSASGFASITNFYPENGATEVGYGANSPKKFQITFDREIANDGAIAQVDLSTPGAFSVYRASDDQPVYQSTQYSTQNFLIVYQQEKILSIASTELDADTEYYITLDAGIVQFKDGTTNPAIAKGEWQFTTGGTTLEPPTQMYTVSYDLDGGSGGPASASYAAGAEVTIPATVPIKDGYTFAGWRWSGAPVIYQPGNVFTMLDQDVTLIALWEERKASEIDNDNVFIKQSSGSTCTLASATMMLRRRAILDGISDWQSITEDSVGESAWKNGKLLTTFDYRGMHTTAYVGANIYNMDLGTKKQYFISQLAAHPEGIVAWRYKKNDTKEQ